MKTFGFDFYTLNDEILSVDLGEFASTVEATRHAKAVLAAKLTAVAVDVWCEGDHVARIERGAAPSMQ